MSVYVSTTFAADQSSVVEAVETLNRQNITRIELGSTHKSEAGLLSRLKDKGCHYLTHNFFPPVPERIVLNIASGDEAIRQRSLAFIREGIDFAVALQAEIYTIHPGFLIDPSGEGRSGRNYDFYFSPSSSVSPEHHARGIRLFLQSLREISEYVEDKAIRIAVETQGAVAKRDFILFSRPDDFDLFLGERLGGKIGLNLNLAHLDLAARAWGFDPFKVVEKLSPVIVAVEVSHSEGNTDQHGALKPGSWYLDLLKDGLFKTIPVIFEGRNLQIGEVIASHRLLVDTVGQAGSKK